ncbi:cation diffusion facilitator family transporter [Leptolinea tardivitalis]|uniref:Cation transporter n=1 Tax=Leptolinea tardivitalis TaxID=229920 RepID=A0A0P6WL10_9CHLR|nr:cation diffusion facilitator family transporter [Leptolinea tardivitalis]KPL70463.1 cation transporter [Leptolinea tardivitalis]GAP22050.1 cation diffusion facilitator family transporter [Leptolinea tardivitalis]
MQSIRTQKSKPGEQALYRTALIITLCGNTLLVAIKWAAAYFSGSVALLADTANSASDVLYSLMMVLGIWMSQRPPDSSHPQGHSRFEPLVGLMITFSMTFAGYAAVRASIERFLEGGKAIELGLPTFVLLLAAGIKAGMFVWIRNIANKLHSPTLATTATDNLSDVLTSTAAFVGIAGSDFIHPLADPVAGILVALWIFRAAFMAARDNLGFLTGAGAPEELRQNLVAAAESVPGVMHVHHAITEYSGPRLVVDMHINVDGNMPLNQVHEICDQVIERLEEFPEVDRAYVHIEPEGWD